MRARRLSGHGLQQARNLGLSCRRGYDNTGSTGSKQATRARRRNASYFSGNQPRVGFPPQVAQIRVAKPGNTDQGSSRREEWRSRATSWSAWFVMSPAQAWERKLSRGFNRCYSKAHRESASGVEDRWSVLQVDELVRKMRGATRDPCKPQCAGSSRTCQPVTMASPRVARLVLLRPVADASGPNLKKLYEF